MSPQVDIIGSGLHIKSNNVEFLLQLVKPKRLNPSQTLDQHGFGWTFQGVCDRLSPNWYDIWCQSGSSSTVYYLPPTCIARGQVAYHLLSNLLPAAEGGDLGDSLGAISMFDNCFLGL